MKNIIILILIAFTFSSCKTTQRIVVKKSISKKLSPKPETEVSFDTNLINKNVNISDETTHYLATAEVNKVNSIIDYAKQFSGVKYMFGGNSFDGIDCSGLVFESFKTVDIFLPRISRDMAKQGEKITLTDTQEGDLLFFKTVSRRNSISHVGLVVSNQNGNVEFIHSTTRAGVIVSKLSENYWSNAFVEARRIL